MNSVDSSSQVNVQPRDNPSASSAAPSRSLLESWRRRHPVHNWLTSDQLARQSRTWLILALSLILLSPLVGYFFDASAKDFFEHNPWRNWAKHITGVGEASAYLTLSLGLWVMGQGILPKVHSRRSESWRRMGRVAGFFLAGFLLSGLYVQVAKALIGRRRPLDPGLERVFEFSPFNTHWDFHSYPSGHSQVLMSFAVLTSLLFPRYAWALVLLAVSAASTRVMVLQHYPSDVMAGLGVGILGALSLRRIWIWRTQAQAPSSAGRT